MRLTGTAECRKSTFSSTVLHPGERHSVPWDSVPHSHRPHQNHRQPIKTVRQPTHRRPDNTNPDSQPTGDQTTLTPAVRPPAIIPHNPDSQTTRAIAGFTDESGLKKVKADKIGM